MNTPPTIKDRVTDLEDRNTATDQVVEEGRTITVKEVFERVVALETRLDLLREESKEIAGRFAVISFSIVVLSLANIGVSLLIYTSLRGIL